MPETCDVPQDSITFEESLCSPKQDENQTFEEERIPEDVNKVGECSEQDVFCDEKASNVQTPCKSPTAAHLEFSESEDIFATPSSPVIEPARPANDLDMTSLDESSVLCPVPTANMAASPANPREKRKIVPLVLLSDVESPNLLEERKKSPWKSKHDRPQNQNSRLKCKRTGVKRKVLTATDSKTHLSSLEVTPHVGPVKRKRLLQTKLSPSSFASKQPSAKQRLEEYNGNTSK